MTASIKTMKHILSLPEISREVDFVHEAYCIQCGLGGYVKGVDGANFYFYESQGPFCNSKCFADYLGVDVSDLPKVKKAGRLKD